MKIIFEGTETELRSALSSFGVSNKVIFDDGKEFVPFACCDYIGRGHRQKRSDYTIGELIKNHYDKIKKFSADNTATTKPEAVNEALNSSEVDIDLNAMVENASKLKL